jgi:thiamine-monophosphate kinase
MTARGRGEFEKIARLASRFARTAEGVSVGIGDDAAVLAPPRGRSIVWTIDEHVERTHFRRELLTWADEGWRSFMAAASDLAAMGADPWCALSALVLPPDFEDDSLDDLAEGQRLASDTVGAPIVGGNLARGEGVAITTTLLGTCERAVLRSGAVVGDDLLIAGPIGLAGAGLTALERAMRDPRLRPAIAAWLRPRALLEEGKALGAIAHAANDVSDGLAQDALHLADASRVCIVLDEMELRAHTGDALVRAAEALGLDWLDLALHGGEDYALVAASPEPIVGFARIGRVREGRGVVLATPFGERAIEPRGFDHFGQ